MTVSVVIPALNEEELVARAILSALDDGAEEVVVVDGGSVDGTVEAAAPLAHVVSAEPGRARQMNAGARESHGDILLFLHADTRLTPGSVEQVRQAIASGAAAGCFRPRFDPESPVLRFYGALAALPLKSICFGDRALFATRHAFEVVGGYSDIPIFEDLDLVKRLSRYGRFIRLPHAIITSSRRFAKVGPLRQQLLNLLLWSGYHLGVRPHRLARHYRYGPSDAQRIV